MADADETWKNLSLEERLMSNVCFREREKQEKHVLTPDIAMESEKGRVHRDKIASGTRGCQ